MNDVTIFIYLVFFIMEASATFAFMWKMMSSTLAEMDRKPVTNYGEVMKAYTPHPEEPKDGEEVMGVTFKSCDLDDYGKLQSRINELREKLEGEDDGDIVVRR